MNTIEDIVNEINKIRRNSGNSWYTYNTEFNGISISIKGYKTWVQKMVIGNAVVGSSCMEMKVKEFKRWIRESIKQNTRELL